MRPDPQDHALQALMLPFEQRLLDWPGEGPVLFLRARDGFALHRQRLPGLICEQSFRPEAERLERSGLRVRDAADVAGMEDEDGGHRLVLLLPPRQREESRALLARAVAACAPGGRVLACVPNNEGAKSAEDDLRRLAGPVASLSKHKCRVFWTAPLTGPADAMLLEEWRRLDAVRPVADGRLLSRPGVFAWDRIDTASGLLIEHLPGDLSGRVADLGAGIGVLAQALLERCAGIAALDLYEAEARALDLARRNLAGARVPVGFHWHDVTAGIPDGYDAIVMNPPFHAQGRGDRPDIGRRFIQVAAEALKPGGRLWMVANRHLPYEDVLGTAFGELRVHAQRDGFKVVEGIRARGRAVR